MNEVATMGYGRSASLGWRSGLSVVLAMGMAGASSTAWAGDEIVAEPGDVLAVSVIEDPDLGRDARVSVNGTIVLPRLDEIDVAGQDLATIRARIESELRDRGIIRTPTVIVEFASYRPFYVGGAVAKPGAIPFELGITVRHALILAGGLDTDGDVETLAPESLGELRTQLRLTSYELLQCDSLIARLNAELHHDQSADVQGLDTGLVAEDDAKGILALDTSVLGDRTAEWTAEEEHRHTALALVNAEIDILQRQAALQQREQDIQEEEMENARSLVEQGVMPRSQLQNLEREASQLSRGVLESQSFAARARQERADAEHQIRNAETEWRLDVQDRLRTAMLERVRLRAEIETMSDRLLDLGLALDESGDLVSPTPSVTIYRSGVSGSATFAGELDTAVLPGDVLDVSLARPPEG